MTKSSRQRKRDRSRRQETTRNAEAVLQELVEQARRAAQDQLDRMYDSTTPTTEIARLLIEQYDGEPVAPGSALLLAAKGHSIAKLKEVADAIAADLPGSLTALTFAGALAHTAGEVSSAYHFVEEALATSPEPETRAQLTGHLLFQERVAEALDVLEPRLLEHPDDRAAADWYGMAVAAAFENLSAPQPERICPCGSDLLWTDCCAVRERAALDRFADRSGMYELRESVTGFVAASPYAEPVRDAVVKWLVEVEQCAPDEGADGAGLQLMALEHALLTSGLDPDGADDADCALAAFAADPATPPMLAARASDWARHVQYGLWRVDDPTPAPGLWCTEIVSGISRYVAFAEEQVESLPSWAVLLGAVVPVDGVWRAAGASVQLSLSEADDAAEFVLAAVGSLLTELTGRGARKARRPPAGRIFSGMAAPRSVLVDDAEEADPTVARLIGMVTGSLLPRLVGELVATRSRTPQLTNTDGDPLCLMQARVAVRDGLALATRLAGHPDFSATDGGQPLELTWWGAQVPPGQRAAMLAEAAAQLRAQGRDPMEIESDGEGQRWVRGTMAISGDELRVEVNSQQRLTRLLQLLGDLGGQPDVLDESRVDPAQDMAWGRADPVAHRVVARASARPEDGWEKYWLDEAVPALEGRTPRQAAAGPERPLLERLLREFERESDQGGRTAGAIPDTDWLRDQLGMVRGGWR